MTVAGRDDTPSEAQVLSAEEVAEIADFLPRGLGVPPKKLLALASSHEALRARVAAALRERDEASVEQLREHVRAVAAESRCKELEQERDEAQRILSERIIGGRSFSTLVSEWLSANEKTPDQVLHGMFPLGMVGRWVERTEAAESRCRQLETSLRELPDEELCIDLRADAMAIIAADARTVKAVELRQIAAQLRDLLTAVMNARRAVVPASGDQPTVRHYPGGMTVAEYIAEMDGTGTGRAALVSAENGQT